MTTEKKAPARTVDSAHTLDAMLAGASQELRKIAPKYVNVGRLISLAIEAKQRNPTLANCSPMSVLRFCKTCAEWGTDRVGAGGVWPVPFWNSKANSFDMTAIPDWRFLIERMKKSKVLTHATADAVFEKDSFDYSRGTTPTLSHKPARGDRGKVTEVYCVYTLIDGTKDFVVMDWERDVLPIRDRSKAWQNYLKSKTSCPWVTDEVQMGLKTVVKRAMKLFEGASPELTAMIESDNVVNGFADLLEPAPIEMPRELPSPAPQSAGEPTQENNTPADWKSVPVHFGKNKGKLLGELPPDTLAWYIHEWEPKPWKGKISATDSAFRAALDASIADQGDPPSDDAAPGEGSQPDAQAKAGDAQLPIQMQLADQLVEAGISFETFRAFLKEKNLVKDPDSLGSISDVPDSVCVTIARTKNLFNALLKLGNPVPE